MMYETYTKGFFKTAAGFNLRDIRTRIYDMSQADFGKHVLKCTASRVSQMELGKTDLTPTAKTLVEKYNAI